MVDPDTFLQFGIGINPLWPGVKLSRGDSRWTRHTRNFHRERHTMDSLIQRIAGDGCAIAPVMRHGYRRIENFISAQHIGLNDDRVPKSLQSRPWPTIHS